MEQYNKIRQKAVAALVVCALLWSTSGFVLKSVREMDSMRISGYRCLVASLFLLLLRSRLHTRLTIHKDKWFWTGCVSYAGASLLIVLANQYTTAANAIILQYIAPLFVCIFNAFLLKKRPEKDNYIVIAAVIVGLAFFFQEALSMNRTYMLGNILAIGAGAVMAMQAVSVCQIKNASSVNLVIIGGGFLNFICCFPFMEHTSAPFTDYVCVIFLGICQLGVSYALYSWAVVYLSPLEVILIPAIEPLVNPLLTLLTRGEKITVHTLLGGVIVVGSITIWSIWKEKNKAV